MGEPSKYVIIFPFVIVILAIIFTPLASQHTIQTDELHLIGYNFSNDLPTLTVSLYNPRPESIVIKAVIINGVYYRETLLKTSTYGTGTAGNDSISALFPPAGTYYCLASLCKIPGNSVGRIYVGLLWEKGLTYEVVISTETVSISYLLNAPT
ncbi:hypothetical protein HRbin01_00284 [archaeon HR01]|nr:hypothetical protein HRbin01_00284 [archaeon HR01]